MKYIFYRGPRAGQLINLETKSLHYFEGGDRYLVYDGGLLLYSPVSDCSCASQQNFSGMDEAVDCAIRELREGWSVRIVMKKGSGAVELVDSDGNSYSVRDDRGLAHEVLAAVQIPAESERKVRERHLAVIDSSRTNR